MNTPNASPECLTLTSIQDVRNANELQRSLNKLLSTSSSVTIDCSQIESLDAACLQLLLAAKREFQNQLQIVVETNCEAAKWIQYSGLTNALLGSTSTSSVA